MNRILFLFHAICALSLAGFVSACQDNDEFTTSSSALLTFAVDTLKMDTVFSKVGSSTYSFWVYNRGSKGVRIDQVRLAKGNQTGFRVNVDGSYLDNSLGSVATQLEVRGGDSLRVFVELTAPISSDNAPRMIADRLVFLLESGVEQEVALQGWAWNALMVRDLVVSSDTLIRSAQPIVVYGGIDVKSGATLTIRQSQLFFHDQASIHVYGRLITDSVVMRGDRLDHMFDYLPYDRVSGQWGGIRFYDSSTANRMVRTEIRNASNAIRCDSALLAPDKQRLYMEQCVVHNCKGNGLELYNAYVGIKDCQVTNTLGDCIVAYGGAVLIDGCTLAQFYPFSADRGVGLRFYNALNDYEYPLETLSCTNTILTGYADDELMGSQQKEEAAFNYVFENCLLRTPEVKDDTLHFKKILWEKSSDDVQGKKHFVLIDEDNLVYDFHLDSLSTAHGLGCYR